MRMDYHGGNFFDDVRCIIFAQGEVPDSIAQTKSIFLESGFNATINSFHIALMRFSIDFGKG